MRKLIQKAIDYLDGLRNGLVVEDCLQNDEKASCEVIKAIIKINELEDQLNQIRRDPNDEEVVLVSEDENFKCYEGIVNGRKFRYHEAKINPKYNCPNHLVPTLERGLKSIRIPCACDDRSN